jgi:hypothetical protein
MGAQGLTARGAPANQPPFLFYLKIAILVLSFIILAMAAWSIAIFNSWVGYLGGNGVGGLVIFVVIKTWLIYGIMMFLEFKANHLFYRIVAVVLYSISIIFWLSAWAYSASLAGFWLSYTCYGGFCDNTWTSEGAALAVCAALGAVVWVLSIVHLVFFIRACLNDTTIMTNNQAELGQVHPIKQEATTTVYQQGPAPAQYQQVPPQEYQQPHQQQQYAPQ